MSYVRWNRINFRLPFRLFCAFCRSKTTFGPISVRLTAQTTSIAPLCVETCTTSLVWRFDVEGYDRSNTLSLHFCNTGTSYYGDSCLLFQSEYFMGPIFRVGLGYCTAGGPPTWSHGLQKVDGLLVGDLIKTQRPCFSFCIQFLWRSLISLTMSAVWKPPMI